MAILGSIKNTLSSALPSLGSLTPKVQASISNEDHADAGLQYRQGSKLFLLGPSSAQKLSTVAVSDQFLRWSSVKLEDFARSFGYEFIIYELFPGGGGEIHDRMPLPINPQSVHMDVQPATNLTVTAKGIVEESNGAPLRPIRIQGTTGMLPLTGFGRAAGANSNTSNAVADIAAYAFKNTLRQVDRTISQVGKTIAAFMGSAQKMSYLNYQPDEARELTTGYEFFQRFMRFLDYYLAAKKQNRRLRLAFHLYKDQMYYDVVLGPYSFVKQGMEYQYNLQMMAYRRRPTPDVYRNSGVARLQQTAMSPTQVDSLNALASAINGIRQAKVALAQSFKIMAGIRADIEGTFITPVNELNMFVTNLVNLPRQAVEYYRVVGLAAMGQAFSDAYYNNWKNGFDLKEQDVSNAARAADVSTQGNVSDQLAAQGESDQARLAGDQQGSVEAGTSPISGMLSDRPADNVLNEGAISQMLDGVNPDDLPLSDQAREAMAAEDLRLSLLTPDDFRERRDRIANFAASISEAFGGSSDTFSRVAGLPPPRDTFRELGTEEIEILDKLNDVLMSYDAAIRAMEEVVPSSANDFYSFWGEQARAINVPFQNAPSVFYAPVPHGATLEAIAMTYLGDAQRWVELAATNGLKPPYIDEEGFEVPLVGNGAGNSVLVALADNLYIGQKVQVVSDAVKASPRKIVGIQVLTETEALVALDGDPNLALYSVADDARLLAYLPGTVNSQSLIAVPSEKPVSVPGRIKTTPGVEDLNGLVKIAKVDLMLDSEGDVVVGSFGDVRLAYGLTNLVQAAVIKVKTKRMSLLQDPQFGNAVEPGTSVADLDARRYLDELNEAFRDDLRFEGLSAAQVKIDGPTMQVNVLVRIANTDVYLPVAARVPI
jgi:hypothetical protein